MFYGFLRLRFVKVSGLLNMAGRLWETLVLRLRSWVWLFVAYYDLSSTVVRKSKVLVVNGSIILLISLLFSVTLSDYSDFSVFPGAPVLAVLYLLRELKAPNPAHSILFLYFSYYSAYSSALQNRF